MYKRALTQIKQTDEKVLRVSIVAALDPQRGSFPLVICVTVWCVHPFYLSFFAHVLIKSIKIIEAGLDGHFPPPGFQVKFLC